ncbi:MAG: helix-turn-helix domain-containing protein [Clostridia bacterium]|nr:helix-turn-helix domain-containing protein [Clostridia bacterium]
MEVFAKRLCELRAEKHISQAQLAKMIGSSCGIICYWETDRSEPTAPYLVKLAEIFDVSVDYLLGRSEF